ncbi:MAG TPA: hypothetical protein VFM86_06465 [Pedococcus sp.]|nr:hypothetical protein [Pedococcus sp.]
MPGEIATYLLGAQGGDEDAFARLYAATNPVLVRYLRSIGVGDAAGVALASWPTLLGRLPACPADDDDWFELAVGAARETATAGGSPALGTSAPPVPSREPAGSTPAAAAPAAAGAAPGAAAVDAGVAALQACGPDSADVLAMAVVAGLGRDSMARLTGQEPTAVLELVRRGQYRLTLPLEELYAAMAAPARPDELADAAVVQGLFGDTGRAAAVPPAPGAVPGAQTGPGPAAVAAVTLTPVAGAALTEPSVVDLLTWQTPAAGPTLVRPVPPRGAREASRGARAGAGAAAWVIALGGVGAAAAMSGLLPAVVDNLFRGPVNRPVVTAQGPVVPGPTASGGGPTVTPPGVEPTKPGTQPGTQPGQPPVGGGTVEPVGLTGSGTAGTVVISTAAFTTPAGGGAAPTGGSSGGPAGSSTPPPATSGGGVVVGGGTVTGGGTTTGGAVTGSGKPITGTANGHTPTRTAAAAARAQAKAAAAAARARAKAERAAAKARAQAEKAKAAKAAKAKAAKAAKAKAAKAKAAKAKAAKAKAAKAKAAKAKAASAKGKKA